MPAHWNTTLSGDSAGTGFSVGADTAMLTPIHAKARRNLLGPASVEQGGVIYAGCDSFRRYVPLLLGRDVHAKPLA